MDSTLTSEHPFTIDLAAHEPKECEVGRRSVHYIISIKPVIVWAQLSGNPQDQSAGRRHCLGAPGGLRRARATWQRYTSSPYG